MQVKESSTVAVLEGQITGRYGLLLSQTQLAELLGRTTGGLRYSLSYPSDHQTRALRPAVAKSAAVFINPATEVAQIIVGTGAQ